MAYPILVSVVGAFTVFVLLSFVIPKLTTIFSELGQILPLPTRILIKISNFFAEFWWLVLAFAALLVFLLARIKKTKKGKLRFDKFLLNIPVFGEFIKKIEIGRLT